VFLADSPASVRIAGQDSGDKPRALETEVNLTFRLVPTVVSTVMQTTEIRAAMRPIFNGGGAGLVF
jgi:hypothetical protein